MLLLLKEEKIKAIIGFSLMILLIGCSSTRIQTKDIMEDQKVIDDQKAEILRQAGIIEDMKDKQNKVNTALSNAVSKATDAIEQCTELKELFTVIDQFVKEVIEAKGELYDME